ncbi:XXYS1_4_G0037160.mRNA.1.CDS.1 [Saccharomyces cerevisiae]|nr:EM14S01-3B_G0034570.mRNA.1.CDS.1 [Saccharomyces cerevisiae]CAD6626671.1 XXYS1_4_G0037160.mRNA.1.CDS.1 [Saccharomyces cerevisiae]CAI4491751.1 AMH_1a_G0021590.mRNA.1.CDS.1 [Saccharomyces cerevisiae]CAI4502554.1 CEI_1a_G0021510.mRNA.1.CDS.1 [Saccharomyces cerevisiae]CAI6685691.1 AMH_1a_G0021590.mRNA.1.CDS.1 [Saccharomyces cerevisiae]
MSRRNPPGSRNGGGPTNASPFIKRDRMRRNFLRMRMGQNGSNSSSPGVPNGDNSRGSLVKKDDPEYAEEREKMLLQIGVEADAGRSNVKVKDEDPNEYNEFPLRAIPKEDLENMRTHLLKFQSKKKINPVTDFHLPVRLHRKDTRNLQFQLTRAEIVQRQKEISEYKKKAEQERSTPNSGGINKPGTVSLNNTVKDGSQTPTVDSVTKDNTVNGVNSSIPTVTGSSVPPASPTTVSAVESNGLSNGSTSAANGLDGNASTANLANGKPLMTKLEDAGPAEDPTKVGMVKYDGKEVTNEPEFEEGTMDPLADVAPDGGGRAKRGNLRRKTRQLKVLDENAKKLRFEEFYPWVMEDFDGYNTWVGSYEAGNSDSYVLLSVEDDGSFTMIPADKVYKFTARNKYATLTIDEAEKRMDKKSGEVPRWLMKHLDNIGTTTTRYDRTRRKLKAVADQQAMDEDDRDDNSEVELDYDEEFADDEEAPIIDGNEQENKESEQRIKKEMLQANAMGLRDEEAPSENEEDELFGEKKIDEDGERIKKALQKTELAALYSSDENEINPYLSESDIENKENESPVKKEEDSDILSKSKRSSPKKQQRKATNAHVHKEPTLRVKSIKNCVIILKGDKKILKSFPEGEWNPQTAKAVDSSNNASNAVPLPIKQEEGLNSTVAEREETPAPTITEKDIIEAIGDGKVNIKEFGKFIRRKYPGAENKKLMFAIVKKLCRKVGNDHMELKKE